VVSGKINGLGIWTRPQMFDLQQRFIVLAAKPSLPGSEGVARLDMSGDRLAILSGFAQPRHRPCSEARPDTAAVPEREASIGRLEALGCRTLKR
jgi:hypothetical protein